MAEQAEISKKVQFEETEFDIKFKLYETNKLTIEVFDEKNLKKKYKNEFVFLPESEFQVSSPSTDYQIITSNAFDTMKELFDFISIEVFENNFYKIQNQDENTILFIVVVNFKEINFVLSLEDDNQNKLLKTLSKYKARIIQVEQQNNQFLSQYIEQNIKISNLEFQNSQLTEKITQVEEKSAKQDEEIKSIQESMLQLNQALKQMQQNQQELQQKQPQQQMQQQQIQQPTIQPQQVIQQFTGDLNIEDIYRQLKQVKQKYKEQEPLLKEQAIAKLFNESNILKTRQKHQKLFEGWMPKKVKNVNLIFRSTQHGITAQAFHERCDNKGPTILIILTKQGYVFGGFTTQNWQRTNEYVESKDNFIFSLDKQDKLTIMDNDQFSNAQMNDKLNGPRFGAGCDLGIFGNEQNQGWSNLGKTYKSEKIKQVDDNSKKYLAGAQQFIMGEWEIFQVEM